MTNSEQIARVCAKWAIFIAFCSLSLLFTSHAQAATVYGNTTEESPTSNGMLIRYNEAGTNSGTGRAVAEQFFVTNNFTSSTLTIYAGKVVLSGTGEDALRVQLCIPNPLWQDQTDPCASPVVSYLDTNISPTDLPVHSVSPGATTPTVIDIGTSIDFEPGIGYLLAFSRTGDENSTNDYRIKYNIGDYSGGSLYNSMHGCTTPNWVQTESEASGCSGTEISSYDLLFSLTSYGQNELTLEAATAGSKVFVSGACVEPADLPNGWVLYNNVVDVKYTDTSATGTWILGQYECVDGIYTSAPSGVSLWNGEFLIEAEQSGTPKTFEAVSQTVTIDGSSVQNPTANLVENCSRDETWISCAIYSFIKSVLAVRPFSWIAQLGGALNADPGVSWQSTETAATVPTNWNMVANLGSADALKVNGQSLVTWNLDPTASGSTTWTIAREFFDFRGYLVWCVYFEYLFFAGYLVNRVRTLLS